MFVGSGTSYYLAANRVAAYLFQVTVMSTYVVLSILLTGMNFLLARKGSRQVRDEPT